MLSNKNDPNKKKLQSIIAYTDMSDSVGGHTGNHGRASSLKIKTRVNHCVIVDVSVTVLALSKISLTEQTFDAQFVCRCITVNIKEPR